MAALTESAGAFGCIYSELPGAQSRQEITVLSGQDLDANEVVGKVSIGAISQAYAGTGDGLMGTLARAATYCEPGAWKVRCIQAVANGGIFEVVDPNGEVRGHAVVGVAFSSGIAFTIADGVTDFVVGDVFTVTVAAGTGKWKAVDVAALDGSQVAAGVLGAAVDATAGDTKGVVIWQHAEINKSEIDWGALTVGAQRTAAEAELLAVGIILREAV